MFSFNTVHILKSIITDLGEFEFELLNSHVDATEDTPVDGGEGSFPEHVTRTPLHVALTHLALRQHVTSLEALNLVLKTPGAQLTICSAKLALENYLT